MKVLAVAKASVARLAPSLRYRVAATAHGPVIQWHGESRYSAEELTNLRVAQPGDVNRTYQAVEWLRGILATQALSKEEIVARGAAQGGHSERTLVRAARILGVKFTRAGFPAKSEWALPRTSHEGDGAPRAA